MINVRRNSKKRLLTDSAMDTLSLPRTGEWTDPILEIDRALDELTPDDWADAAGIFRRSGVVYLPRIGYALASSEERFLDPAISDGKAKNVSYDPRTGRIGGTMLQGAARRAVGATMQRFADWAEALVLALVPGLAGGFERGLTSLRPVEAEGRAASQRKDDTRLHVDAFRARPVQGRRILRVFANVDPAGRPRVWELGEPFEAIARRFVPHAHGPLPGTSWMLERLGITKGRRSAYDHFMLQLHDLAKADDSYQRAAPRTRIAFPSGTSWLACTDATAHAVVSGQHALEQTFFVEAEFARRSAQAPLKVLERLSGHALV